MAQYKDLKGIVLIKLRYFDYVLLVVHGPPMNRTKKSSNEVGKSANLAVLSHDYFSIDKEKIRNIESILTIVGGKVVYATNDSQNLAPSLYQLSLHG